MSGKKRQFIIRLWLSNVYSELFSQTNIVNSNKNLKSSFEIRLYIFLSFSAKYFDVID